MLKILIILTGGISSDGISSAWLNICKNLNKNLSENIKIDFLAINEVSDNNGIKKFKELGYEILLTPLRQSNPIKYIKNLRKILREGKYDTVHVNGSSALMILEMFSSKLEKVKKRIAHSHNTTCNNKLLHKILFLPFNRLTTLKLACGKEAGKWLFGKYSFTVFHNGINLNLFKFNPNLRSNVRKELGLNEGTIAFGHVGKFNCQKNHYFLIHIFNEIIKIKPNSKLFLFGDGELVEETKYLISSLNLIDKVIFMGVKNNIELYLQGLDEMILPSRFEGLPNVVIEWQAAGLPIIISDSVTRECSVSDLVKFIPLKESYHTWALSAINFLDTHTNRSVQSNSAIESLKQNGYDINSQTHNLLDIYKS